MALLVFLLCTLLKLIFWMVALTVLLSYTVAWYEYASSRKDPINARFTCRNLGFAFWVMIQEAICLTATILLRPSGWLPVLMPPPDEALGKLPVILLHGLFQNRSCMFWMQFRLRARGYRQVISISTPPWQDLESLTEVLAQKVDELRAGLKVDKVILVGHSMGGIIARNYVQSRGGMDKVALMVTLGSPHRGSKLAIFAVSPMGKNLLPGSDFLHRLNSTPWPGNIPAISIYTRHDNMVLPVVLSLMDGAENIELSGMGHTSLLFHPFAIQQVIDALDKGST